ncbi:MAG: SAM-dependent chlorinase/fluorinase [Thermoguttaceae bacterium]|jgi:S-adenosylmethionine hydrolase|nr:SAM-dependent chlorinase/fluorinase [Thermoguttaceae bacterium]
MSIITLTTDFGAGSPYVAAMKGVILSINPDVTLVDLTHDVPAQDVRYGAMILDSVCPRFPAGTVHVAVVDPGVGTDRAIVYARIGGQQFIAPDNGLLSRLAERNRPDQIIRLVNPEFWLPEVSATFHGRDIMAPAAAHLTRGVAPEQLGPPHEGLVAIQWLRVHRGERRLEGAVEQIDSYGNLITNITVDMLEGRPTDERACIICGIYETFGIYRTYADQPPGTLVALIGSSGQLELAVVGDNAASRLGIEIGALVVVAWE